MKRSNVKRLGNYLLDAQARLSAIRRGGVIDLPPVINDIDQAISLLKELENETR